MASRALVLTVTFALVSGPAVAVDAPGPVVPAAPAGTEDKPSEARQHAMRAVAWVSLCMILALIIFIASLMIASRRFRARILGWNRKVGFGKLRDVWWQGPEKHGPSKNKPDSE